MKWIYGQPSISSDYLCAIMGMDRPFMLTWRNDKKEWGDWNHGEYDDGILEWEPFDNDKVLYYMSFDDIPMPENW